MMTSVPGAAGGSKLLSDIVAEKRKTQMPHVRTIMDAVAEIKSEDPDSIITAYMVRRAINEGRLPAVRSGRAIYVDVAAVRRFLAGSLE